MKACRTWRIPALFSLGILLMQAGWIFALPPYAGIDEFDHAYRASGVAHGQWIAPPTDATRGTGASVRVPGDIVAAAEPQCRAFGYTTDADCSPHAQLDGGFVEVASGAGRYNPVAYWVIGQPASGLDGNAALYMMRAITALICAALLTLAAWTTASWARTRWPLTALLLAMTPVFIYSTSIVSPNGIEMSAAASVWCALLGLTRISDAPTRNRLLWSAVPGAAILLTVRSMGPLWLALIAATVIALFNRPDLMALLKTQRRTIVSIVGLLSATGLASLAWILSQRSLVIGKEDHVEPGAVSHTLPQIPLWLFQSIAAFPTRSEQAPTVVYAGGLVVGLIFTSTVFAVASRKYRLTLTAMFVLIVGIPLAIGIATYYQFGTSWQGRYGLPFAIGFLLVGGLCLEQSPPRHRFIAPLALGSALVMFVVHVTGITNVLIRERRESPLAGTSAWVEPQPWMIVTMFAFAWIALLLAVWAKAPTPADESWMTAAAEPVKVSA